jgi:glyoxylase-like metal-dependent hydrolase (beta-lactamase superfamily II)
MACGRSALLKPPTKSPSSLTPGRWIRTPWPSARTLLFPDTPPSAILYDRRMPHRQTSVGRFDVVPLCDGWAPLPLQDECPGQDVNWDRERARYPWAFAGRASWAWHVHAFLLRGPDRTLLIDTGIGDLGRPPYDVVGRLDLELERVDCRAGDVSAVIHTHLHADHAGGACRPNGEPRFPNARHVVHPADWSFFASGSGDEFMGRRAMARLEREGMVDLDPDDRAVSAGVRVVHTPGHTPGHRSILLGDGDETMLFAGDLLHVPPQIAHPAWPSNHDVDEVVARRSREALVGQARERGWRVAVSHFGNPFGAVESHGWRSESDP